MPKAEESPALTITISQEGSAEIVWRDSDGTITKRALVINVSGSAAIEKSVCDIILNDREGGFYTLTDDTLQLVSAKSDHVANHL